MKKIFLILTLAATMLLSGCESDRKIINGITYTTYGLINERENHNPNIQYELSPTAIILSVIFCETIIVPVYFVGFDLYVPIGKRDPNWVPGQISPVAK